MGTRHAAAIPGDVFTVDRVLPHNLEAERAVLGAVLMHTEALTVAEGLLEPSDFYRDAHRRIFAAMLAVQDDGADIDPVTLRAKLKQVGDLEEVGGPAYLAALTDGMPHASNVDHYSQLVKEASQLRNVIHTANKLLGHAYDAETRAVELAADAADRLYDVTSAAVAGQAVSIKDLMTPGIEALEYACAHRDMVTGVATGFRDLDDMTSGMHPGDLMLIAARTSVGKTALAMNIARHVATTRPVMVFSLEMSRMQLFQRLLSAESRVDSQRMRTGRFLDSDWNKLALAMSTLGAAQLYIDDTPSIGVREVRARSRQLRADQPLGLIVVDYLQLMRGRGRFDNRTQEIGTISRGLKAVAKELRVPVIALAQLSRAAEGQFGRKPRKPKLSDLRESGDLEADADVVFLLWRPDAKESDGIIQTVSLEAEVIVAKQRNGPTGTVALAWQPDCVRFETPRGA